MEYRFLGRTGVQVSPLCLGTMNFGDQTEEVDAHQILDRALEHGINFVDTWTRSFQGRAALLPRPTQW